MARRPLIRPAPIEITETRVSTEDEDEVQLGFVAGRIVQAWSRTLIRQACRDRFGFGKTRTDNLIRRALDGLRGDHERDVYARVKQIGRLHALLVELHTPRYHPTKMVPGRDGQGRAIEVPMRLPKPVLQIERIERLLAELEGNRVPERVEVSVTMTAAMSAVIGQMSGERLEEFVASARERRRLALVASNGKVG